MFATRRWAPARPGEVAAGLRDADLWCGSRAPCGRLNGQGERGGIDHVALVSDGVSLVAVITAIDADGALHIALR